MKLVCAAILVAFAVGAAGQQQTSPQSPPTATPPITTQPDKDVGRQMPPDTRAKEPSSSEVEQQIRKKIDSEPGLAGASRKVKVNNAAVVLSGVAGDNAQHQAARRIAESYAGPRKIVDQIRMKR